MALPYVTGPVLCYVGRTGGVTPGATSAGPSGVSTAKFLGTAEVCPQSEIHRSHKPVYNDLSGEEPLDYAQTGTSAFVSLDINRFNWSVYDHLRTMNPFVVTNPGIDLFSERGRLMITEGKGIMMWLAFPHAGSEAVYRNNNAPAGLRFLAGVLLEDKTPEMGSRAVKHHLAFHFLKTFDINNGEEKLFDYNMNGLPGIN